MKKFQTIFYLDDDIDDLDYFKEIAEGLGHTVLTFMNGRDMLVELSMQITKPDIIFLDIHMPILNGEEILNIIKTTDDWKHIPVVMVSGAYPKKLAKNFMDVGVNYLMKKHHINDYRAELERVLTMDLQSTQASNNTI